MYDTRPRPGRRRSVQHAHGLPIPAMLGPDPTQLPWAQPTRQLATTHRVGLRMGGSLTDNRRWLEHLDALSTPRTSRSRRCSGRTPHSCLGRSQQGSSRRRIGLDSGWAAAWPTTGDARTPRRAQHVTDNPVLTMLGPGPHGCLGLSQQGRSRQRSRLEWLACAPTSMPRRRLQARARHRQRFQGDRTRQSLAEAGVHHTATRLPSAIRSLRSDMQSWRSLVRGRTPKRNFKQDLHRPVTDQADPSQPNDWR